MSNFEAINEPPHLRQVGFCIRLNAILRAFLSHYYASATCVKSLVYALFSLFLIASVSYIFLLMNPAPLTGTSISTIYKDYTPVPLQYNTDDLELHATSSLMAPLIQAQDGALRNDG